jgi:hypothetical protein
MSNIGTKCLRKLWYTKNAPELAEPIRPEVRLKFLIGDILEELILWLAGIAGHKVEGRQDELTLEGVTGHRDAVIDGSIADVKSASSRSFAKFEGGLRPEDDTFGYLHQLGGYQQASKGDHRVTSPVAAFIAVDKTLGKIHVDEHEGLTERTDYPSLYKKVISAVNQSEPPARAFEDEKDGESGNRKLGTVCSYCEFKEACWPGLRTFAYSNGPRYLTVVKRQPAEHIQEIT